MVYASLCVVCLLLWGNHSKRSCLLPGKTRQLDASVSAGSEGSSSPESSESESESEVDSEEERRRKRRLKWVESYQHYVVYLKGYITCRKLWLISVSKFSTTSC